MKIAILTIHHVPNYGAIMQAFSLKNSIRQLGFDCDVVNYQPKTATDFYRIRGKFLGRLIQSIRYKRFKKFVDSNIISDGRPVLTTTEDVYDFIANYDVVICGSDQIWHANGFRGCDRTFFLGSSDFPSTKKISYAPSIGSCDPLAYLQSWPECGKWLKDFDAISVRDASSQKMVERFGLPTPELVCDPTLLPAAISEFSAANSGKQNLLLVYGTPPLEYAEKICSIADKYRLKIVSVGRRCKFSHKDYLFANPKTWATLFSNAKIVVTNKFHGTQLSIRNNALPFYIGTAEKKAKVHDSLNRYGLINQWIESPDDLSETNIEAGMAQLKNVESLRNDIASKSLAWLKSQLN